MQVVILTGNGTIKTAVTAMQAGATTYLTKPLDISELRTVVDKASQTQRLSRSNVSSLYWTPAQMIAHHTSGGCNLNPGDLLGTGTVSGKAKESRGCLLELTTRGKDRIALPGGETRAFLEDGDEVVFTASCQREGFARIGFGECRGVVIG